MLPFILILLIAVVNLVATNRNKTMFLKELDPVNDQVVLFKERQEGPVGVLTTSNGARVSYRDATNSLNSVLMNNEFLMEDLAHFNRERITERVVHAKGAGAFGYFVVTQDIRSICKAEMFNKIGKKTPVAVRFSPVRPEKGGNEIVRGARGFAVKFYTLDGNLDIVGFNTPMFVFKDPLKFANFVRSSRRNPATNTASQQTLWDFFTLNPEVFHHILVQMGDAGIPASYANMPGFSIHTYQVKNKQGVPHFVRFHFTPDAGLKNLTTEEAGRITATDLDYLTRTLYRDIEKGKFPSWTLSIQVLTLDDVIKSQYDAFDTTRVLSLKKYPLKEVGKLVLDRNPKNFFAEIEQLAFCPGNLVTGIQGDPSKLFESRRFFYKDAQNYRLGVNFNKISVNCPYRTQVLTYNRDGEAPVKDNEEDAPNYYPNSFYGPVPYMSTLKSELISIIEKPGVNNFDQAYELYEDLNDGERNRTTVNIVSALAQTAWTTQKKAIEIFRTIHPDLGYRVAQGLKGNQK